jgi:pimeloyl-ACP methyl ester carboxylesterase
MPAFETFDGLSLAYDVAGEGPDVLLLHGIVVDSFINFVRPGVVDALTGAGFRVITLDQRGHGESAKPHDESAYADGAMVRDAKALLDHVGIERCAFVGYSMGAMVGMELIGDEPRIAVAVLGGVGGNTLRRRETESSPMAEAMLADDKTTVNPVVRSFRDFADLIKADKKAIAAAAGGLRRDLDPSRIAVPTLVLCGNNDPLAGDPAELAGKIVGAEVRVVGGTHLNVVNNPEFHQALVGFLDAHRAEVSGAAR